MNHKCKVRTWIFVVLLSLLLIGIPVSAYDAWEPSATGSGLQELNNTVDKLVTLVEKAKQANAAHPDFIRDLENALFALTAQAKSLADRGGSSTWNSYSSTYSSDDLPIEPTEITGPDVRYLGLIEDKVGSWSVSEPDGKLDAAMQMRMYFPHKVEIRNIQLYKSDSEGKKGNRWWHSHSSDSWILGVFENGRMLNPERPQTLGIYKGWVVFDLYGADQPPSFEKDEYLLFIVTTNEGEYELLYRVGGLEEKFASF